MYRYIDVSNWIWINGVITFSGPTTKGWGGGVLLSRGTQIVIKKFQATAEYYIYMYLKPGIGGWVRALIDRLLKIPYHATALVCTII